MNTEIISITDKIKEAVNCERIYLFGSHAYGVPREDSDYDFYVIIPDDDIRPIKAMKKIYGALAKTKMNIPVDILADRASRFEKKSGLPTLESAIAGKGVLLYDRNGIDMQMVGA